MKLKFGAALALVFMAAAAPMAVHAQDGGGGGRAVVGPYAVDKFKTTYVRLGQSNEGLLYEPNTVGEKGRIAVIFSHPGGNNFNAEIGRELATRGYRTLMVNYRSDKGEEPQEELILPGLSRAIGYMRTLPGVQKVVIVGHSGGGHLIPLYQNVAENGAKACQGPEVLYPCSGKNLDGMNKADGMIVLDGTLGAFHQMSAIDPAVDGTGSTKRNPALDMFSAANGYDAAGKGGKYSPAFAKAFYAGQQKRNEEIVDLALKRLAALKAGTSQYSDDEPFIVRGMGVQATGARLYQPDPTFAGHTKTAHILLKADGTEPTVIIPSVRPASATRAVNQLNSLSAMSQDTTVRDYLAHSAIRTTANYAITADDIVGVNWKSNYTSTPASAEGVTAPSLILAMSCHYLIVPDEIIYNHLAAKDKTFAVVEGATHGFSPCGPQYGDTVKRTFDYVDRWLSAAGRF